MPSLPASQPAHSLQRAGGACLAGLLSSPSSHCQDSESVGIQWLSANAEVQPTVCRTQTSAQICDLAGDMSHAAPDLGVLQLQGAYTDGMLTPSKLIERLYPLLEAAGAAIIHLLPLQAILERCR